MRRICMRAAGAVLAAFGLLGGASPAQAGFVSVTPPTAEYTDLLNPTSVEVQFGSVFDLTLTTGDVGSTFVADTTTDGFSQMAASLTDGVDEKIDLRFIPIGDFKIALKKGNLDEGWFFNNPGWDTGAAPPDLAGYTVTGITFTLDSLTITPSGNYDTNGNPLSNFSVQGTFIFDVDPVAAPAPPGVLLGLTGAGCLGAVGLVRRRKAVAA